MKNIFYLFLVFTFIGTISSCKQDKKANAVEVSEKQEVKEVMGATVLNVNTAASSVAWEGTKPGGAHNGTIAVSEGTVQMENGEVVGGSFTMDMNTIKNLDLAGDEGAGKLEGHLKAPDFFDVAQFPTAKFEITKVAKLANDDKATHLIYGNLTLKDATKQIGFKSNIKSEPGAMKVSTPEFVINRADFNIKYGSKSFFDNLKDKYIDDNIKLSITLVAGK